MTASIPSSQNGHHIWQV